MNYSAPVIINGKELHIGQSMTLRVALISFLEAMKEPNALGNDEHGKSMVSNYINRCNEIVALLDGAK